MALITLISLITLITPISLISLITLITPISLISLISLITLKNPNKSNKSNKPNKLFNRDGEHKGGGFITLAVESYGQMRTGEIVRNHENHGEFMKKSCKSWRSDENRGKSWGSDGNDGKIMKLLEHTGNRGN
jgi:hypothetical protein